MTFDILEKDKMWLSNFGLGKDLQEISLQQT